MNIKQDWNCWSIRAILIWIKLNKCSIDLFLAKIFWVPQWFLFHWWFFDGFFSFKNKISVNDCHKFVISFINIFCFCGFQAKLTNQCCWSLSRQQFINYWFNRSLLWFHQLLNMNVTAVDSIDNIVSNSLQNVKDFLWSIVRFILEWL